MCIMTSSMQFSSLRMLCTLTVLCLVTLSNHVRAGTVNDPSMGVSDLSPPTLLVPRDLSYKGVVLNTQGTIGGRPCDDGLLSHTSPALVRGGGLIPAGYHPLGYQITALGERFLEFGQTCLESDVGRLLASLKTKRKTMSTIQTQWLEIVRVSKSGQSMRIYRSLKDLIDFCLAARLID